MMKRLFKIRSTAGVRYHEPNPYAVKSVGFSKLDGFPIFEMTLEQGISVNFEWFARSFVIDGRPGYTIQEEDIELVSPLDDVYQHIPGLTDVPSKPMEAHIGKLYYVDYVYENDDERLILML